MCYDTWPEAFGFVANNGKQKADSGGVENLQKYGGNVDLIITHEPPAKIKDFLMLHSGSDASITAINTYLEDVSRICKFKHWYFGSLHMDKFISSSHTCVFNNIINAKTGEVVTR